MNTGTLCGVWKDDWGKRVCHIAEHEEHGYSVREAHELKAASRIMIWHGETVQDLFDFILKGRFGGDDFRIVLRAPWGKNKAMREWFGRIDQGGTRIAWEGRRGTSFWHKIG